MKKLVKSLVRNLLFALKTICRVNFVKTVYINFATQNFLTACKLPIFIYKNVKLKSLRGSIRINAPIKTGMLKFGYKYIDLFPASLLPSYVKINGKMVVYGNVIIGGGVHFNIDRKDATINIGKNCTIGGGSFIKSTNMIIIEDNVQITGECILMDSEMHFIKDLAVDDVKINYGSVIIRKNSWINQRSVVTKNTIIPEYCVITRNSFLNRDYSSYGTNLLISGSPAKVIKNNIQRIFNVEMEHELDNLFRVTNSPKSINFSRTLANDQNNSPIFSWNR